MNSNPIIRIEDLSKSFRRPSASETTLRGRVLHPFSRTVNEQFEALRDVSFEIASGEFFGVVGRNGSGKSTLLKLIAGIYRPDRGRITVDGTLASFIELGVGFNPELSGRDNLYINGALLGLSRREVRRRYDSIVDFAELHEFMEMKLQNFSSGMQVRLAFSIALESGSDVLLTDEVLAVGDERFQRKCYDVFRTYKKAGKTLVFVSHDMSSVEALCDRALILEKGGVIGLGTPRDVAHMYHTVNLPPLPVHAGSAAAQETSTSSQDPLSHAMETATILRTWTTTTDGSERQSFDQATPVVTQVSFVTPTAVRQPVVMISVVDRIGQSVFNASTALKGLTLPATRPGETICTHFAFHNHLAQGAYLVTSKVHSADGCLLDEATDATAFQVVCETDSGGLVDLPHHITFEHIRCPDSGSPLHSHEPTGDHHDDTTRT